eukprot:153595-Chlamydomonas_euryale.AAC.2
MEWRCGQCWWVGVALWAVLVARRGAVGGAGGTERRCGRCRWHGVVLWAVLVATSGAWYPQRVSGHGIRSGRQGDDWQASASAKDALAAGARRAVRMPAASGVLECGRADLRANSGEGSCCGQVWSDDTHAVHTMDKQPPGSQPGSQAQPRKQGPLRINAAARAHDSPSAPRVTLPSPPRPRPRRRRMTHLPHSIRRCWHHQP